MRFGLCDLGRWSRSESSKPTLLKDTENVNVILGNLMVAACEKGTVLSLKIYHNTRPG